MPHDSALESGHASASNALSHDTWLRYWRALNWDTFHAYSYGSERATLFFERELQARFSRNRADKKITLSIARRHIYIYTVSQFSCIFTQFLVFRSLRVILQRWSRLQRWSQDFWNPWKCLKVKKHIDGGVKSMWLQGRKFRTLSEKPKNENRVCGDQVMSIEAESWSSLIKQNFENLVIIIDIFLGP